nr:MAG TPA: hypothetical protein [Herelleviridae sp.]
MERSKNVFLVRIRKTRDFGRVRVVWKREAIK